MKFGSVCSGIEAASVAWNPIGWEAAFLSEIEPFPCALLKHYYPEVPNHGDMTKFKEWPDYAIDVLCGGTPCQSFSVAGLRAGLDDPRGNLMLTYLAIAERYRPRWLVWENVPGVLSSNKGRDFGAFLGGLGKLGYGFAYRVLDAQYFGLAQRRKRVFVVAHIGDWQRPAAVLFERESLSGNIKPSREKGAIVAALTARGVGTCGADDNQAQAGHIISFHGSQDPNVSGNLSNCLGRNNGLESCIAINEISHTLTAGGHDASEDGSGRGIPIVAQATAGFKAGQGSKAGSIAYNENVFPTLGAANSGLNQSPTLLHKSEIRRLTPRECERLQGFPDDYTLIPVRGKPAADAPRYKAIGNSWAVPVVRWIGERISIVDKIEGKND